MEKEVIIQFDSDAHNEYRELQDAVEKGKSTKKKTTYEQLLNSINNAIRNIKVNPHYGDLIPRNT